MNHEKRDRAAPTCCMSSAISALLITAFRSVIVVTLSFLLCFLSILLLSTIEVSSSFLFRPPICPLETIVTFRALFRPIGLCSELDYLIKARTQGPFSSQRRQLSRLSEHSYSQTKKLADLNLRGTRKHLETDSTEEDFSAWNIDVNLLSPWKSSCGHRSNCRDEKATESSLCHSGNECK